MCFSLNSLVRIFFFFFAKFSFWLQGMGCEPQGCSHPLAGGGGPGGGGVGVGRGRWRAAGAGAKW